VSIRFQNTYDKTVINSIHEYTFGKSGSANASTCTLGADNASIAKIYYIIINNIFSQIVTNKNVTIFQAFEFFFILS